MSGFGLVEDLSRRLKCFSGLERVTCRSVGEGEEFMKTVMVEQRYKSTTRTFEHSRPDMGVNRSLNKEMLLAMTANGD